MQASRDSIDFVSLFMEQLAFNNVGRSCLVWLLSSLPSTSKAPASTVNLRLISQNFSASSESANASISLSEVMRLGFTFIEGPNTLQQDPLKSFATAIAFICSFYEIQKSQYVKPSSPQHQQPQQQQQQEQPELEVPSGLQICDCPADVSSHPLLYVLTTLHESEQELKGTKQIWDTVFNFVAHQIIYFQQLCPGVRQRVVSDTFKWLLQSDLAGDTKCTSAEFLCIRLLSVIPVSTFVRFSEVGLISFFCDVFTGEAQGRTLLQWLDKITSNHSDPECSVCGSSPCDPSRRRMFVPYSKVILKTILVPLIFHRCLQWVAVDGLSSKDLMSSSDAVPDGLSPEAVLARKAAMRLLLALWDHPTQNSSPDGFAFRKSICLLLGRDFVFDLSDVGRVSELQSIVRTFSLPPHPSWDAVIEESRSPQKSEESGRLASCLDWMLVQMIKYRSNLAHDTEFLEKTIGFQLVQMEGIKFADHLALARPPRVKDIQRSTKQQPIALISLLSLPPCELLIVLSVDVSLTRALQFLTEEVNHTNIVHHLKWHLGLPSPNMFYLKLPSALSYLTSVYRILPATYRDQKRDEDSVALWDSSLFASESAVDTNLKKGMGISELIKQLAIVSLFSPLAPSTTLQARANRSLLLDWCFKFFNPALAIEVLEAETSLLKAAQEPKAEMVELSREEEAGRNSGALEKANNLSGWMGEFGTSNVRLIDEQLIPCWSLFIAIQNVCFPRCGSESNFSGSKQRTEYTPSLFADLIWNLSSPVSSGIISRERKTNEPYGVHPLLTSTIHFFKLTLQEWHRLLGSAFLIAVSLSFFEYSINQLKLAQKLPEYPTDSTAVIASYFDRDSGHIPIPPPVVAYYNAVCKHTLVGRLLILAGIEPQVVMFKSPVVPSDKWPTSLSSRKSFRLPTLGPGVLENDLNFRTPPFSEEFLGTFLLQILKIVCRLLLSFLPTAWPLPRLRSLINKEN